MRSASPARLTAALFDLDGTIVHTDALHLAAYNEVLAPHGIEVDEAYYRVGVMGRENRAILQDLIPQGTVALWDAVAERKEEAFRRRVGELAPATGFLELLAWLEAKGHGVAVVTNAPRQNAELMIDAIGLTARLPLLVIGEELPRGKPDPLPYVTALRQLGVESAAGVAFEDSLSGVTAAVGARLYTFGMTTALSPAALTRAGAATAIADFTDPRLWDFLERHG